MSIHYPLSEEFTPYGPLLTPHIRLQVNTIYGWRPYQFLLDTGADFTVVPESLATLIDLDLRRCPQEYTLGIDDRPLPARVGSITISLGDEIVRVRCHFLKSENTPYLLGRMDLFSRFDIFLRNGQRRVSFTRIKI